MLRTDSKNGIPGTQVETALVGHWTLDLPPGVNKHGPMSLPPEPSGMGLVDTTTTQDLIWVWQLQSDAETSF
jgi:hypothetical protein